jgi:hypothetical protein
MMLLLWIMPVLRTNRGDSSLADESQQYVLCQASCSLCSSVTVQSHLVPLVSISYVLMCLSVKQINRTAFAINKSTDESNCSLFVMSYTIFSIDWSEFIFLFHEIRNEHFPVLSPRII